MSSIEEGARRAVAEDVDVVVALFAVALDELTPHRGGAMWARHEARAEPVATGLEAALADPDQLLVVGTIDGSVVGYAAVRLDPLHGGGTVALLTDVYVLADARGVGVGEAMLELCVDWARERGSVGIDSLALPGDRDTKNFFETFGMVARAIVVHRPLDRHDPT